MKKQKLFLSILFAFGFSGEFTLNENNFNESPSITFNMGEVDFESSNNYKKIVSSSKGLTQVEGAPELPTYTFSYAISNNKNYEIDYSVLEYEIYDNINLYPAQSMKNEDQFIKNQGLYDSEEIYPENNLNINRQSLRGHHLLGVELIPYEYNFQLKQLKVYKTVEIYIHEIGDRNELTINQKSKVFEDIYNSIIINNGSTLNDNRNFQKPSILYILENYTSVIENLVEWRRKQGFIVTVIDDNDINGSFNTSNIKSYISNAYNNWENPPEYVCLVGDANGSYDIPTYSVGDGGGWWGAYGEGDFPYTLLDGNDNLPDIVIGRMSVRSGTELTTVINKIIGYEKNYVNNTDWLNAAALVGDPYDSGISTVITNEYIETAMNIHGGITDIRTKYSGSSFDSFMRNQINDGVSYLNYRGFYGFSNFTSNDVDQLTNGYKLPFLTTLTCDTGSFETMNECITESLFRAGTPTSPKGAVAVVGTAQPYTHTAFNNIVAMGMYEGVFINGAKTAGEALIHGQLALAEIYPQNPNNNVYYFSTWNNLMGDPATQLWTSRAIDLIVDHNEYLLNGTNNFQVSVTNEYDQPYENALVSLYKTSNGNIQLQMNSYTNSSGIADFEIDNSITGDVFVTTRCHNCMPVETEFEIRDDFPEVVLDELSISISDASGNNDGNFNPGETVEVSFNIENLSDSQIDDLSLEVVNSSNLMSIENGNLFSFNIYPNGGVQIEGVQITAPSDISDSINPEFKVHLYNSSGDLYWNYNLPINFLSGQIEISAHVVDDSNNNGLLERGEEGSIELIVYNVGSINLNQPVITINNVNPNLSFSSSEFTFPFDINIGEQGTSNSIQINVDQNAIHGSIISIPLAFTSYNGYTTNSVVQIQVGDLTVNDPMGPDNYGYYIYDMNDTDYEIAPEYDWIEIDPNYDGDGHSIAGLGDSGDNLDDVATINLPFTFTYYGIDYDEVSICTNGWISFGETSMRSFRNYTVPGPGGPSPMVAVFWDDLKTTSGGQIYTYHDTQNNAFIIEWSELRTFLNNSIETFQIILYDSGWQTPTGDDEMKIQFKEFNNTSIGDYPVGNYDGAVIHGQYCTVGLENHSASDGLQYTYNNSYHQAAMPLSDQTAIFITTRTSSDLAEPAFNYDVESFDFTLQADEETSSQITITNSGEDGSVLYYSTNISPFQSNVDQVDDYGYAWTDTNTQGEYEWIDIESDYTTVTLPDNDGGGIVDIGFNFPFYETSYSFCAAMANGWIGFTGTSESWNNGSVFDDDSPSGAIFGFWDDLYPESLANDDGSGNIKYHSNGDRLVVWYDHVRHWTSSERIYDFQIVLYKSGKISINYREMIGDTDSATVGIMDSNGNFGLEVLYNQDGYVQDDLSVLFDVAPAWVQIQSENSSGQIISGQSQSIILNVDSNGIGNGIYNAYLIFETNADEMPYASIPISLTVSMNLGDVNQDGIIDILDLVKVVSIILNNYNPSELEYILADVNQDGTVDVLDAVSIVNTILNR